MGPLDALFGILAEKEKREHKPVTMPDERGWAWYGRFAKNPTPPFRLPTDEAGPSPPVTPPLAAMFGKR